LAIAIFGVALTGCGSGSHMAGPPPPVGNTKVVVLLTSTANDQLAIFDLSLVSVALTDSTGKSTTIFTSANRQFGAGIEWMHLNGAAEPLVTATLPQGTYTAATVTAAGCAFTNVTFAAPNLTTATFDEGLCGQGTGVTTRQPVQPNRGRRLRDGPISESASAAVLYAKRNGCYRNLHYISHVQSHSRVDRG